MFSVNHANAVTPPSTGLGLPDMKPIIEICNVGTTNGLLYANKWQYYVAKIPDMSGNYKLTYTVSNQSLQFCQEDGCSGDAWGTQINCNMFNNCTIDQLVNQANIENIYANTSESGIYDNEGLKKLLNSNKCPQYIYIGSSQSKQKLGFIFSSKPINNAKEELQNKGYTVDFEQTGTSLTEEAKKNYNNQVNKMKQNIQKFKDNDWANTYNEECSKFSMFGAMHINENVEIEYYDKYKSELLKAEPTYDFSEGEKVLVEYKTMKCAAEPDNSSDTNIIDGTEVTGCEVIPPVIRKWINNILNFVKYVALALVIILGVLDFIKAAASGEPDQMKKSGQAFLKRVIAVVILFLLPYIIDLILNLVDLAGVDKDNIDCMKEI